MRFIADFHIHSRFARATSPEMNTRSLAKWSQFKGTHIVGTGDFTHPEWFAELQETLEPAEPGLFRLKPAFEKEVAREVPSSCRRAMRFLLTSEISTIYKKGDRVRKVHSLIFAPSFAVVEKINTTLGKIGNLHSDGRPIIGLDTKDLLKVALAASPECVFVPAHAWTPHFSVFGSMSGFDSLEECFDELAPEIFAIETGLSSDPAMNWRLSALDNIALISNSDAHSPQKLGREATVFNTELSYDAIRDALKQNNTTSFEKTIEFFPEEGKYHYDGHRHCKVRLTPEETAEHNGRCPECGKKVTVGVLSRVAELADRPAGRAPKGVVRTRPFVSIIPLPEILAEIESVGPHSKRVQGKYFDILARLGNEFFILLEASFADIAAAGGASAAEAVRRMREGEIHIDPGYDGEYGHVSIWSEGEVGETRAGAFAPACENQNILF